MTRVDYPITTWRLVKTPADSGAWNMALDEAILDSVGRKISLPTLRLFAWSPPCISIGYAQPIGDIDKERLSNHGWDVVRRITGGRAILHTDELTYSVIGPYDEPRLTGGVLESYLRLSQALLNSVKALGVEAQVLQKPSTMSSGKNQQGPICFEVPSNYEITSQGKKLIGSAQARKKMGILQHGTLPLNGDLTRISQVLKVPQDMDNTKQGEAIRRILDRATTIELITGSKISWVVAASAFEQAFKETLNIRFEESDPTKSEIIKTNNLIKQKFANPTWTERI
jgi:lipoate-protein ligase A